MRRASEQYAALDVADDPMWADLSEQGKDRVRALKLLGAKQVHPVLLSALDRFSVQELERLLRLVEVLIVRYQLIGGGRTGRLEITAASLAVQIWDRRVKSAKDALRVVKDIYPSDDAFRDSFKTKQERSNQKALWVLANLERQARQAAGIGPAAHELAPSGSLTLEHVLPKNPGTAWDAALCRDQSLAEDMTFRLGNMCLLTKINRALGNKGFEEKRKTYARSELILAKKIADCEEWTRRSIEHRQAYLAKLAVALWRFE